MPRVVLDLRMVEGRLHGIARYALEVARRISAIAPPQWELVALVAPDGAPRATEGAPRIQCVRARAPFLSPLEQLDLAYTLAHLRADLFHATSFSVPLLWPGRLVATLHDANHLAMPQHYGRAQHLYYRAVVSPRIRLRCDVLTVSEFSRSELSRYLHLPLERVRVLPLGVDETFHRRSPEVVDEARVRLGLPERYFLAIGNPKPHKNLRFVTALAGQLPHPLVLVAGKHGRELVELPRATVVLDEVAEADLPALYSGATALLLPSLYEGFGLPAVEAMACRCPVVAANTSALKDVVGSRGVLLPPTDRDAWLRAARQLSGERDEAHLARAEMQTRAAHDWNEHGRALLRVYETALA